MFRFETCDEEHTLLQTARNTIVLGVRGDTLRNLPECIPKDGPSRKTPKNRGEGVKEMGNEEEGECSWEGGIDLFF